MEGGLGQRGRNRAVVVDRIEVNFYSEKSLGLSFDCRPFGSDGTKVGGLRFLLCAASDGLGLVA